MSFLNAINPFFRKRPFIIFAYARTGSYLLVDLLNQFDEIVCFGEIFKKEAVELPDEIRSRINFNVEKRDSNPHAFIKKIIKLNPKKHTGFKLLFGQSSEVRKWAMSSHKIKRIVLIRNPFEVFVSLQRAKATGIWIDHMGNKLEEMPRLKFFAKDFDQAVDHIQNYIKWAKQLAEKDHKSTLLIDYKDLSDSNKIKDIAAFLGTEKNPEKIEYRLHKQTKERYSELYENFDELFAHVKINYADIWIDPEKI